MTDRLFDLKQAEKLLPQLARWLRTALVARKQIADIEHEYARLVESISKSGGRWVDVPHFIHRKQEREEWASRLRCAAQDIEKAGCLLKDLDVGLVDFPCEVDGRVVYLCWRLDEPSIGFWHNTDEGYAGRKPIDAKFLAKSKKRKSGNRSQESES